MSLRSRIPFAAALLAAISPLCLAQSNVNPSAAADAAAPTEVPVIPVAELKKAETEPIARAHQDAVVLETITVVATQNARNIAEVPHSVEVLDRDLIERSQATDLADLLDHVPGIELLGGPRPDAESLTIRGLGGLSGTRVVMLVDGAHQHLDRGVLSRLNVDPALLKSVEVLKGPASVLYGSGAIGGVVSLTTKDAFDLLEDGRNWGVRLRAAYQSADEGRQGGGAVFGTAGPLDGLADFQLHQAEDFRQGGGTTMPYSGRESRSDLAKLGWALSDRSTLRLSSTGFHVESVTLANPTQPVADDNPLRAREQDQRFSRLAYESEFDAGAFNRLRAAIDHSDYNSVEQELSADETPTAEPPRIYDLQTVGGDFSTGLAATAWSQQLTLGAEYHVDDGQARQGGEPITNFPDAEQTNYGFYLQDELSPLPDLDVVAGVRYDRYQSRPSDHIAAEPVDEDAVSSQLGATLALGRGFSFAALYSEAFRAPSLRESYSFGQHFMGNEFVINPELRPETAANKEISLRYRGQPFGLDVLGGSLTVFQNDVRDFMEMIVTVEVEGPVPPPVQCLPPMPAVGCVNRDNPMAPPIFIGGTTTTVNLPRARLRGVEASLDFRMDWFEVNGSYALVRGEDAETGEPLSAIPADTGSLILGAHVGGFRAELSVLAAANQDRVPAPREDRLATSVPTPGYTVYGAGLHWQVRTGWLQGLSLRLAVDNLTDKRYRNHLTFHESHYEVGRNVKASLAFPL